MDNKIKVVIPKEAKGRILAEWLTENGYYVNEPCGGMGRCGKCIVTVVSGEFTDFSGNNIVKDSTVLSCRAVCTDNEAVILIPVRESGTDVADTSDNKTDITLDDNIGFALDIGTTTLALALVNRENGEIIRAVSEINPQRQYGADVITRISSCEQGKLDDMRSCLMQSVSEMIVKLAGTADTTRYDMTVAGNTTMLHIFSGVSPVGIGRFPFTPEFVDSKTLKGDECGLKLNNVYVLPSASAYIGADIVAGISSVELNKSDDAMMLIDIGTNGEMALYTGEELITASTAAGPALEGANISCGMGGVNGAVSKVELIGDEYRFHVIGDTDPEGICGSGLVDLFACLLESGFMDESGALDDDFMLYGVQVTKNAEIRRDETKVVITQKDVRQFQLANSAIRAGAEALLDEGGIDAESVKKLYIAGGLGFYLSTDSAVRTGMLNPCVADKSVAVGNSSLKGAAIALKGDITAQIEKLTSISKSCRNIELNESDCFNDGFIEYMMFPEAD